jgi:uncharacterized membrane protein
MPWRPKITVAGLRPNSEARTRSVVLAVSTVAIVAIAAAVIVVALLIMYVLPRGGRRRRP